MDVLDAVVLIGARLYFFLLHESLHDKLKEGVVLMYWCMRMSVCV